MSTCFITMDLLRIVILLFFAYGINCRIVKDRLRYGRNKKIKDDVRQFSVEEYLEQYGYLQKPSAGEGNIQHSEEDRIYAIRMFQRFAGLPASGELNRKTIVKMRMRRCGVPDVIDGRDPTKPLEYNLNEKWDNKIVTWNVQSYSSRLSEKKQRHAFNNAFNRWNNSSGLDIRLAAADENADINILFASGDHGDGYPFDGQGGKLAHAYAPKDGRTHFDADENWRYHSNRGTELEITATHEFGHALGLGHSMTRGSIMVPFYQKYRSGFQLHADDIAGIQSLYGPPKQSNEIPDLVDTTTKATTTTAATVDIDLSVCASKFHAITRGPQGYIHLFIGLNLYKLKDSCSPNKSCILPGYPRPVRSVYKRAPRHIGAAAFIPDERQRTYFFKGRSIWRYTGYKLDPGYPRRFNKTVMPYKPTAAYIHKNQYADYQLYLFGLGLPVSYDRVLAISTSVANRLTKQYEEQGVVYICRQLELVNCTDVVRYIAVQSIAKTLGPERAPVLPLFHAVTGCDTVSAFHGKGKKSARDTWMAYEQLPDAFAIIMKPAPQFDVFMPILQRFVVVLSDRTSSAERVDEARMQLFVQKGRQIDSQSIFRSRFVTAYGECYILRFIGMGKCSGAKPYATKPR